MSFRLATLATTVTLLVACHGGGNHPNDLAGTDGGMFDQGPPTSGLKFAVQPSNVRTGAAITAAVQVSVVDGSGNVITSATDSITLALGTNTAGATLGGTLTKAAVAGVASFADLTLSKAGTGYTLVASAPSRSAATSTAFNDNRVLSFATPVQLATASSVNSQVFTSGHFHSSSFDDFAATQNATNNIIVFLSSATGAFNGGTPFPTGNAPISIVSGDIDGDGKIDLAVQCGTEIDVMLGDGAGNFTKFPFPTGNAASVLAGVGIAKFTKSTKLDVVVADTSDNSIYLYTNTSVAGTPSFTITHVVGPAGLGFAKGIAVGDFNADGAPDAAFGNFTATGTITMWLNANTGAAATTFALGNTSSPPMLDASAVLQTIAAGDFNGDGKSDLFAPDDNPTNAGGIQNQGDVFVAKSGGFNTATETNLGDDPFSATCADFDQDGFVDVGVASFGGLPFGATSPSDFEVLLGNGDGTFQTTKTFITQAGDNSGRAITVGDYNGDGLPDAIVGSAPAWVFLNTSK